VSYYRKGQEAPFERHRSRVPTDFEKQNSVPKLKQHLGEFLGLKEQAKTHGLRNFHLKLYRLAKIQGKTENYAINSDSQWALELPLLLGEETNELNHRLTILASLFF